MRTIADRSRSMLLFRNIPKRVCMRCRKPLEECRDSCVPHGVCVEDRACKCGFFQCACDKTPATSPTPPVGVPSSRVAPSGGEIGASNHEVECLPGWSPCYLGFHRNKNAREGFVASDRGWEALSFSGLISHGHATPIDAMRVVERKLAETDADLPEGWKRSEITTCCAVSGDFWAHDEGDGTYTPCIGISAKPVGAPCQTRIEAIAFCERRAREQGK